MELKDTVQMMLSEDYKERFKAEYYQVVIRYNKLSKMLIDWRAGELDFKPACPRHVLECQLGEMLGYICLLEERALIEKIDISELDIEPF